MKCSIENCQSESRALGLCVKHWNRQRHGTVVCNEPDCDNAQFKDGLCKIHYKIAHKNDLCTINGCKTIARVKGLCQKHYALSGARPECKVEGCSKGRVAKGYCADHYQSTKKQTKICLVEGCNLLVVARGYCTNHYNYYKRIGKLVNVQERVHTKPEERFRQNYHINEVSGCWNWIGKVDRDGYGKFYVDATRPDMFSHRYAWELFMGKVLQPEQIVLHLCDNRRCLNPKHLKIGTRMENVQDMLDKQRNPKGEIIGNSRLSEEEVVYIKHKLAVGEKTGKQLADEFNISESTVSAIKNQVVWRHVQVLKQE